MKASKKGTDLEQAIALIENTILEAVPHLSDKSYKIYLRRIINVDEVKHEIDIWVEFDIGGGYKSIFIFECKNWRKKVGKNDLIIFSKKIEVARAQKGFFVAKSLTKYAIAAAKLDPRMAVLKVTQEFINSEIMGSFHHIMLDKSKTIINVAFYPKNNVIVDTGQVLPMDIQKSIATLNRMPIDCMTYISPKIDNIIVDHMNNLRTNRLSDGVYSFDLEREIEVTPDHLIINDLEISKIKFRITYCLEVVRPAIVSKYEVETRGRVYMFDAVKFGEVGASQITFVETFPQ